MEGNSIPRREDIPEKYTWDLSGLYPDAAAWEKEMGSLEAKIAAVETFRGRLGSTPETLRAFFLREEELSRSLERLYCYAHLRADENTAGAEAQKLISRIRRRYAGAAARTAWIEPELAALPPGKFAEFRNAPALEAYRFKLDELARSRRHLLSDAEETLLGAFSECLGTGGRIFSLLSDADMRFSAVRDGAGNKLTVSHGSYHLLMEHPERAVRRKAFRSMFTAHRRLENTFAAALAATVNTHTVSARVRNFGSALESALFDDDIPVGVYTGLIDAVNSRLDVLHRYLQVRRRIMKLDKLDAYDLYAPLADDPGAKYTFEEAGEMILAALAPMGDEYLGLVKTALRSRWIDVMESAGKRSGAYSSGCYDSAPYILMNFHGTLDDVFTLAHEMGHSMHSCLSRRSQPFHYAGYSIFAAETASITNEMLLFHHLMARTADDDLKFRLFLAVHLAEMFRTTVYRQTMFAEFELAIHRMAEAGEPLVAETLNRVYLELKNRYTGPAVRNSRLVETEWARIPHFHYDFYVYKYATGMAAAVQASSLILSGNPRATAAYLKFLASGASRPVLEIMRDAGLELADGGCVAASLNVFEDTVRTLEELSGRL